MALGSDSISTTVTGAFDAASGMTAVGLAGLLAGIFGTALFLWAAWYFIRASATAYSNGDMSHLFVGILIAAVVLFTGLYIIQYIL